MNLKKLHGIIIAIPTPLLSNEDIDVMSLNNLIEFCITEGANGIMIAGTMGEGPSLIDSQKQILIENAVRIASGRIPVLATVSASSTRKSVENVKTLNKSGADYLVCTAPFYYKYPDPDSVLLHFKKLAAVTEVPLIFYNASGFTGNEVDIETAEKILNMQEVAGIKDSSGNFRNFMELLRRYPDKDNRPGTIMQGDESLFDVSLLMGADGIISGGGVTCIHLLRKLLEAATLDKKLKSFEYQQKFTSELTQLLFPDMQRNWMFNIKNRLVEMDIIQNNCVTTPFLVH
ncbi:MAG: dihydrodipicolinate synthase family protein [Ginsengibacter sp.]